MRAGESEDRQVRRTRKQLREALLDLIVEKGWDAVTVLDICERADVGRSTFYVHFADKEELLLSASTSVSPLSAQRDQRPPGRTDLSNASGRTSSRTG